MHITLINKPSITKLVQHAKWYVGVGLGVCSYFFVALGVTLQKRAHLHWKRNETVRGFAAWFTGLACLILVPFPLNMLIFEFSAQSLMATLEPVTLIFLLGLAWVMHGEKVTMKDGVATLLMAFGAFVCAFTGAHHEKKFTWADLKHLFFQPHFLIFISVSLSILIVILLYILFNMFYGRQPFEDGNISDSSPRLSVFPLLIAIVAAGFGAFMNLSMKFASEAMKTDKATAIVPFCGLATALVFAILQLSFVNLGVKHYKQVLFTPLYQCCLIVFGVLIGFVTWKEYQSLDWLDCTLFVLGVLIVICGLLLLMLRKPPPSPRGMNKQRTIQSDSEVPSDTLI